MIPRLVHLVWIDPTHSGCPPPPDMERNIDAWRRTHPEHKVILWSEATLDPLVRSSSADIREAIETSRFEAMKSDIIRLVLMVSQGGFYSDLKNRPLRRFLYEIEHERSAILTEHPPTIPQYSGRICNAFLGGTAGHDFWRDALAIAVDNVAKRRSGGVVDITGAGVLARTMLRRESADLPGHLVLPVRQVWSDRKYEEAWMERTSASYNIGTATHWSVRQKTESPYLD